jgi:hypothetical protein
MVIRVEPALPCGHVADTQTGRLCGEPTTLAMISPIEVGVWELLPMCSSHLREVVTRDDCPYPWPPSGGFPRTSMPPA